MHTLIAVLRAQEMQASSGKVVNGLRGTLPCKLSLLLVPATVSGRLTADTFV